MSEAVDTLDKKDGKDGGKPSVGEFIRQTREELNKVSYPSAQDVRGTTLIVILNVIFFAVFLFLVDQGWTYVINGLEWLVGKIAGY